MCELFDEMWPFKKLIPPVTHVFDRKGQSIIPAKLKLTWFTTLWPPVWDNVIRFVNPIA